MWISSTVKKVTFQALLPLVFLKYLLINMQIAFPLQNGIKLSSCMRARVHVCVSEMRKGSSAVLMLAILLPTDLLTNIHRVTLSHSNTLSQSGLFKLAALAADSSVPQADKLYQPTHLSVPTITHVHSDSHRHVAFFALSWQGRHLLLLCVQGCVCVWGVHTRVSVESVEMVLKGPEETTIHSWLEYTTHTIAHSPTQDCKHSAST